MFVTPSSAKTLDGLRRLLCFTATTIVFAALAMSTSGRAQRAAIFPQLQVSETFDYRVSYHSDRRVKTEGPVVSALPANAARIDVNALLHGEVLSVQRQGTELLIRLSTRFRVLDSASAFKIPGYDAPKAGMEKHENEGELIEFTIFPDGRIDGIVGLDNFMPEQQQAWQEWASRFALAATIPQKGFHLRQKWTSEQAETSPSPLANLHWLRESTYVGDEPCGPVRLTPEPGLVPNDTGERETCAVIMTTATLRSPAPRTNATPEVFKIHELHTAGTASGKNRIFTYVSLKTGLLVRAREEADQQMDVTVSKTDGSNRVRYAVAAKSQSEVLLVKEMPLLR